jgi:hypothetical protein
MASLAEILYLKKSHVTLVKNLELNFPWLSSFQIFHNVTEVNGRSYCILTWKNWNVYLSGHVGCIYGKFSFSTKENMQC